MTIALFVTLVATLAQAAPVIPGFGRPLFDGVLRKTSLVVHVSDGRVLGVPLASVPPCAMRTVVAPSDVDPKIVVEPPRNVRHSVRVVEPPCR